MRLSYEVVGVRVSSSLFRVVTVEVPHDFVVSEGAFWVKLGVSDVFIYE
jgi:hypothetical protein